MLRPKQVNSVQPSPLIMSPINRRANLPLSSFKLDKLPSPELDYQFVLNTSNRQSNFHNTVKVYPAKFRDNFRNKKLLEALSNSAISMQKDPLDANTNSQIRVLSNIDSYSSKRKALLAFESADHVQINKPDRQMATDSNWFSSSPRKTQQLAAPSSQHSRLILQTDFKYDWAPSPDNQLNSVRNKSI